MYVILKTFDDMWNYVGEVVEQRWKDLVNTFRRKEKSGAGGMTAEQ